MGAKGSKTIEVKINQIVNKEMHRPKVKDGDKEFVLYTKVKGSTDNSETQSSAEKSVAYMNRCEITYNSATNIRRVFITCEGIKLEYYTNPKSDDKKIAPDKYFQHRFETDFSETMKKILEYNMRFQEWQRSQIIGEKCDPPDVYKITGNIFSVFNEPYACNNIEEIYFDWVMLASEECRALMSSFSAGNLVTPQAIAGFMQGKNPNTLVRNNSLERMFIEGAFDSNEKSKLAVGGGEAFRKKFPRLRVIAMISNYGQISKQSSFPHDNDLITCPDVVSTWLDKYRDTLLKECGSYIIESVIGGAGSSVRAVPARNMEFNVKSTQYKFDSEVLSKFVESYKQKIKDKLREEKYGKAEDNKEEKKQAEMNETGNMSEIEEALVSIEKDDEIAFREVFMREILTDKKAGSIVRGFSKENRDRWVKQFGIKGL